MDPLSITASVIAVTQLTGAIIDYLNGVKDAPKDRARCAIEASNVFNLLINLRYRLEEATVDDPWYTETRALAAENGPLDQYKSLLEKLQSKIKPKSGMERLGSRIAWKSIQEDVAAILWRLERLKSLIHIALDMDHFKLSKAIKDYAQNIDNNSRAIKVDMTSLKESQESKTHRDMMNWLSETDFPAQQSDFISRRQKGTGMWFIQSSEFRDWLQGAKPTLFCPGIPGAGKTMIAAIAVDHLCQYSLRDDVGIAYIYGSYKRQESQTTPELLAAVLRQLVQQRPSIGQPVAELHKKHSRLETRPNLDEICTALKSVLAKCSRTFIVVDALDECATGDELLTQLQELQKVADTSLMVTSRPIPRIVQWFRTASVLNIHARDSDIKQFVAGHIGRLPRFVQRDHELQIRIQDAITNATEGMFLLAYLHLDSLRGKLSKKALQSSLDSLPKGSKGLGKAYSEALERIESQLPDESALAKRVLSWIVYAQTPLTAMKLSHALAVEPDGIELDEDNIPDPEDMVSVCGGLVTVDEKTHIIRLVHYTTQEYFESIREVWNPDAQADITATCLTYLSYRGLAYARRNFNGLIDKMRKYIFLRYAARYWGIHAVTVQDKVQEQAYRFLQDKELVSFANEVEQKLTSSVLAWRSEPITVSGVHIAARFGLAKFLDIMINENSPMGGSTNADVQDSTGRTPLAWAAIYGHQTAVEVLLKTKNVDINSQSTRSRKSPLALAAENGHEGVVKLLLATGEVDVNSTSNNGSTPFSLATANGQDGVVKLLLATGKVDVNSTDNYGYTPFSLATEYGNEGIVKLLLATGEVDINSIDREDYTPISRRQ